MSTTKDKSQGPYTVIRLTDRTIPTFVLSGPHHVAAFWAARHHAQSHADDLNAAYSAGQADRDELVKALKDADVIIQRTHDMDRTKYAVVDLDDWKKIQTILSRYSNT